MRLIIFFIYKKIRFAFVILTFIPFTAISNSIEHICEKKLPCYTNQLIHESSPYLIQHAHNPINWHVWSNKTLKKARQQNKPIFLSIGYASCHWCHVMERESFNDLDIAQILNKNFIAIKVDREQKPDIDDFYGNAVMYIKGQQGWPMSVFLTPDGKPFNGGGYYSREEFKSLILKMSDYWNNNQQDAIDKAQAIISALQASDVTHKGAMQIDASTQRRSLKSLFSITDTYNGGFGEASKFPREPWLFLLLDNSYSKTESDDSLLALRLTLTRMAYGGIYDQLAGGFHRYTTDPYWKIPHFEKMLYNQALLIRLYLRTNVIQPDALYMQTAQDTIDFLLTDMQSPEGGFYSSLGAETDKEEGKFYLWKIDEWNNIVDKNSNDLFSEFYDIDEYGEMDDEKNVLYRSLTLKELSSIKKIPENTLRIKLNKLRKQLLKIRNTRSKPSIDKKIIMSWNALTISALTDASLYFNNHSYLQTAVKTADFIWLNMQSNGLFFRIRHNGISLHPAQLDDYAFYLQALIGLYDIDKKQKWLHRAQTIVNIIETHFIDKNNGGYFNTPFESNFSLPYRPKTAFDKTLPSANAIIANMYVRLYRRTGKPEYLEKANQVFSAFSAAANDTPSAFSSLLIATNELSIGEKDLPVYIAQGNIKIDAYIKNLNLNHYDLKIDIEMDSLWHINASQPLSKQLIPTHISPVDRQHWLISDIEYPDPDFVKTQFTSQPLALYKGNIIIKAKLKKNNTKLNPAIQLKLQACNDKICLAPEDITLYPRLFNKNQ